MICLIGNSGLKKHGLDGQTAKVRLYLQKIKDEGFDVFFIDLENFLKHPILILRKIRKGVKMCDRIVLISAERGCKVLIPYINKVNKKYNRKFILPLVGTSVLHYSIDKLTNDQKHNFLTNGNYATVAPNKYLIKQLSKISYILPETDSLSRVFREYYHLDNVFTLNNFRDVKPTNYLKDIKKGTLKIVYLSRVMREKGIFDALEAVKKENNDICSITLDIYGKKILDKKDTLLFNSLLDDNISYCGVLDNSRVIGTLSKYDLFIFPTKFVSEGTPGVIVESLIAGTPVITSDFPQAKLLLEDGKDSLFFKMGNATDLKGKLEFIIKHPNLLKALWMNASKRGKSYTYSVERNRFLKYICGIEE